VTTRVAAVAPPKSHNSIHNRLRWGLVSSVDSRSFCVSCEMRPLMAPSERSMRPEQRRPAVTKRHWWENVLADHCTCPLLSGIGDDQEGWWRSVVAFFQSTYNVILRHATRSRMSKSGLLTVRQNQATGNWELGTQGTAAKARCRNSCFSLKSIFWVFSSQN